MRDMERETAANAVSLLRDLATRLETVGTSAEAEATLREAADSVDRMRERMYQIRLIADPLGVIREAAEMKRHGREF